MTTQKRGYARSIPGDVQRQVSVKLGGTEYDLWLAAAIAEGVTLAEWFRRGAKERIAQGQK